MSRFEKLLLKILRGTPDANVAFDELCLVLRHLGFGERVKGSHHIFFREEIVEILNLQPGTTARQRPIRSSRYAT